MEKVERNHYKITPLGEDRFYEISKERKAKKLNYPPEIMTRKRNYDDLIL